MIILKMGGSGHLCRVFIRKKRNKSGSISIHIVRKQGKGQVHVKSLGSANNDQQLKLLQGLAQQEIERLRHQSTLDLEYPQDKEYVEFVRNSISSIQIVGPELILGKLFNEIGFDIITEPLFKHLVLCRICYPGSKLRTVEYLQRHHNEFYDIDAVYRYLDKINTDYKQQLEHISYRRPAS